MKNSGSKNARASSMRRRISSTSARCARSRSHLRSQFQSSRLNLADLAQLVVARVVDRPVLLVEEREGVLDEHDAVVAAELLGVVAEVGRGHELLADLVLALRPAALAAVRLAAVADRGGELARRSEIFLLVSRSQRPRNSVVSQLSLMISAPSR